MKMGWGEGALEDFVAEFIVPQRDKPREFSGTIPWCRIEDIEGTWLSQSKSGKCVTEATVRNMPLRVFPTGTVIVSCSADLGRCAIAARPLVTNQTFIGLVPNPSLDANFLYYLMSSRASELNTAATGATIKYLSQDKFRKLSVRIPPLSEQRRIVGLLHEAFAGLATAKANSEKNLQNARALFESQLQSVFAQKGEGWTEATIGECIRFIDYRGKTPVKTSSGIRLITAKNVKMGYLQESPKEFIASASYESWMTRGIPRKGDVLFTTEAPLANVAQLDTDEKVAFAQRIIIMQPYAERLDGTFLKYALLSQAVQQRIRTKGTGATVQGIKASLLKLIEISFPRDLRMQARIVFTLEALSAETQRLERRYQQKLAALDALKKSLLHQAFSGSL